MQVLPQSRADQTPIGTLLQNLRGDLLVIFCVTYNLAPQPFFVSFPLCKSMENMREALADAEVFMAQIPAGPQEEDNCLHASQDAPCITFMLNDLQVKGKHDRPLYLSLIHI